MSVLVIAALRTYCQKCQYPQSVCVCQFVPVIASPIQIHVLQHKRERSNAKNTVRLVQLAIPDLFVHCIENDEDIVNAIEALPSGRLAVFYPCERSFTLEEKHEDITPALYAALVFIDGSWKQAGGIARKLPTDKRLDFFHFNSIPSSRYTIRHTNKEYALSTLEAVAVALDKLFDISQHPLLALLDEFQNHWQGPTSHRRHV
ncbi:tRNA-uridine aminocarboxypropyltransferase [Alteromonas sediminis]|uniref:tRNA-uridine aminocarboxypropyltransferase n=1 Tax=Alteromonas sediminis TaxID=2259342 RepID=UPI00140498EC|nr:tRNA-uridine aminocarboxypropyltransferase [Alteromonas sediminis]